MTRRRSSSMLVVNVVRRHIACSPSWIGWGHLPRRALLVQVLRDAVDGVESFLEVTYLRKVERAHGLPAGTRQVRFSDANGIVYRDVEYVDYGVVVELDGRAGHETAQSR